MTEKATWFVPGRFTFRNLPDQLPTFHRRLMISCFLEWSACAPPAGHTHQQRPAGLTLCLRCSSLGLKCDSRWSSFQSWGQDFGRLESRPAKGHQRDCSRLRQEAAAPPPAERSCCLSGDSFLSRLLTRRHTAGTVLSGLICFGAGWGAAIRGVSSAPAGLFHYGWALACSLVLSAAKRRHHSQSTAGELQPEESCMRGFGNEADLTTLTIHHLLGHRTVSCYQLLDAIPIQFQLITTKLLPALFSVTSDRGSAWSFRWSCTLNCKKDSFKRSISSSTKVICEEESSGIWWPDLSRHIKALYEEKVTWIGVPRGGKPVYTQNGHL